MHKALSPILINSRTKRRQAYRAESLKTIWAWWQCKNARRGNEPYFVALKCVSKEQVQPSAELRWRPTLIYSWCYGRSLEPKGSLTAGLDPRKRPNFENSETGEGTRIFRRLQTRTRKERGLIVLAYKTVVRASRSLTQQSCRKRKST